MSDLPRIETKRLVLRVPESSDGAAMARFVTENREHFAPWEPHHPPEYFTEAHWEETLEKSVEEARRGRSLRLVFFAAGDAGGEILGQCAFSRIVRGPFQAALLGYGLHHRVVGKGFMEEGLRGAIDYAFTDLRLHRVMANYMPANERSARLLRKLGFTHEGYARDYLNIAGAWEDHILMSLVNRAWKVEG
ncbi:MAG: GNAT family N-acetyltransferase [Candidatus Eisenbacteria bacterium]